MTGFWIGLVFGLAVATGVAVYHTVILAHISKALHDAEETVHGEAAQFVMHFRKKIGL